MNSNLTPFTSDTAKQAAKLSAQARYKGILVPKTLLFTREQASYLAKLPNASEYLRGLLDESIKNNRVDT